MFSFVASVVAIVVTLVERGNESFDQHIPASKLLGKYSLECL